MGNGHSEVGSSKPPDKPCVEAISTKKRVLCNTPYLTSLFKKLSQQSATKDESSGDKSTARVTQTVFEDAFNGPLKVLGHLLFEHIKASSKTQRRESIHLDEFLQVASDVLGLLSNAQQLSYYYDVFSNHQDYITIENVYHIVQVCFSVSQAVAYLPFDQSDGHDKLLRALAASIVGPTEKVSKEDFVKWCTKHIPHLFNGAHSFLKVKLSGASFADQDWHKRISQGTLSNGTVSMIGTLNEENTILSYCVLWLLSSSLPNLYVMETRQRTPKTSLVPNFLMSRTQMLIEQRPWCCLYNSDIHGLSVNGFEHNVFSYKGPTVMIVSFDHNLYVLATDQEWREGSVCWGGEHTVLYQLRPRFSQVDSGRMVFLNHHTRGMFKGIMLGSNPKSPAIKIEEMSTVWHYGVPIKLDAMEVWGCATSEIRNIQLRQKAWERKEVEKLHNRKLKLENWEDNPDRMLLNWVGISTNHHEKA